MMRWRSNAVVAAVLLLAASPARAAALPPPPAPAASVAVASQGGVVLVSVTARAAPLSAVLAEVGRRAGIEVAVLAPAEPTVSVEFTRLPLDRALERLLVGESFILVYDGAAAGRLRRVIVVGSGVPAPSASPATGTLEPPEGAETVPPAEEGPRVVPEDAGILDPAAPVEQFLVQTAHPDRRLRTAALQGLALHEGDDRARRAVMDHVGDADPYVRAVAVVTLGRFLAEWPGAEDRTVTALQDPVARIRSLALHALVEASSPRAPAALTRALDDADPLVRSFAEELARAGLPGR